MGRVIAMLRNLFVLQALVDVLFGIPLIFATGTILSLYGLSTDRTGVFVSQWLGAAFVALAWISWYARNWPEGEPRRVLVRGGFLPSGDGPFGSLLFPPRSRADAPNLGVLGVARAFLRRWGFLFVTAMA